MQKKPNIDICMNKPKPVCQKGDFIFAAIALEHGHIYSMCKRLIETGAELKWIYDPDAAKTAEFCKAFPDVKVASCEKEVLEDEAVKLIAAAAIPSQRCDLGLRVIDHGKDYFTDKCPFTTLEQLEQARAKTESTGLKYAVFYSERIDNESAVYAGELLKDGAIGRVVQVIGTGPHRINIPARPDWFFQRKHYGGILCDIGSHQIEQFLHYAGAKDAKVLQSKVANYKHKQYLEFEDFGDATLLADNGATNYFRVDWLTPDGLGTWGDGRAFVLGTDGYIEMRKFIDVARQKQGDQLYLVNHEGEYHFSLEGKVGFPYFGQLILDCLNRTETAMSQEHTFKAAELALLAQKQAIRIE